MVGVYTASHDVVHMVCSGMWYGCGVGVGILPIGGVKPGVTVLPLGAGVCFLSE